PLSYDVIKGMSEAWRAQWARHELAHLLNPKLDEEAIQKIAELPTVPSGQSLADTYLETGEVSGRLRRTLIDAGIDVQRLIELDEQQLSIILSRPGRFKGASLSDAILQVKDALTRRGRRLRDATTPSPYNKPIDRSGLQSSILKVVDHLNIENTDQLSRLSKA